MAINQRDPKERDVVNKAGEFCEELTENELEEVSGGTWILIFASMTCTEHDSCTSICMSA